MTASPDDRSPVTRFAPSPTGFLHIGGARTALFSWLYARGRGGAFLLRIEDTDRARHDEAAVAAIVEGLAWLGLDWDGEPVSQYARQERHAEAARDLLAKGAAYKDYMTPEELEAAREAAKAEKRRFESPWRDRDPAEAPADAPYVVRFRAPSEGETTVEDAVQGTVKFPNSALDDLVLLRSDGSPTYNLAVVVDDHDMGVTHVIRGDDHLVNAARQAQIYDALGWARPVFAHVPLIHGPDGAKLSKRHGALGVEAYRDMGFLPEGLANYLLRLGWSHGDEEIVPMARAKEIFDLSGLNKAPARLDLDKLSSVNQHYLREMSDEALAAAAAPFLGRGVDAEDMTRIERAGPFLRDRAKTLKDAADAALFLIAERPLEIAGKPAKALEKEGARELLARLAATLETLEDWTPGVLEDAVKGFVEAENVGFGAVGQPARAALTGGAPAPSLHEVMYALGRAETLARLADQIPA